MEKPKLLITHRFANGVPIAGRCSACRENIDENQPPNDAKTIEAAFDLHVRQKHKPAQDVNQIAARIVKESTGD
jgi:hypothetical protein